METLHLAKRELPDVNRVIAGYEADLSWPRHNLVVEVDGDQFHSDKRLDATKTAAWRRAGHKVRRIAPG